MEITNFKLTKRNKYSLNLRRQNCNTRPYPTIFGDNTWRKYE